MSRDLEKCVLVSYVNGENGDNPILIVGEQKKQGDITILNAIQGSEATEIFKKLTIPKGVLK
jgi:hypothetical protein|nr:MAG TPA: hypothetical protein [Caudoviricetes sp.]